MDSKDFLFRIFFWEGALDILSDERETTNILINMQIWFRNFFKSRNPIILSDGTLDILSNEKWNYKHRN